ncbi:MAG: alpha/beta hydrolase [Desulfomonile tiedjei]|uniref:Alpha/beta hydrolase n=1 Tax=Desulfomonile tiedjei TaxID=2358 RepID=A0A9D6V5H7_9BACT|nr:alpha/beta hydrolase [Desulfomonile tiedjei]
MPQLSVNGRKLGYEIQPMSFDKSKLTVVFIHGTGGDRNDWRGQLDGLSCAANMLALELPGHGASEPPGESSVSEYSRWVVEFINALGLAKVMVVGCSLGSAITQWIALNAAESWLVAVGLVGAGARLKVHPAFLQGLREDSVKALTALADFCLGDRPDPILQKNLRAKLADSSPELIYGDLYACNEFDVMDKVNTISLPTCLIVGEQDKLTPVKYSKYLNEVIKGSVLNVIPNAGHLVSMEQPEQFNKSLGDFLESLSVR